MQWSPPHSDKDKWDTTMWMNLKCMLLSEMSQTQSVTYRMIHLYDVLEKAKQQGREWIGGCQRVAEGKELTAKRRHGAHLWSWNRCVWLCGWRRICQPVELCATDNKLCCMQIKY